MSTTEKVKFGLSNVHFSRRSVSEQNVVTYATPVKCEGAVSLTITRTKEKTSFRADNKDFFTKWLSSSREAQLEIAMLYDWIKTAYLGYKTSDDGKLVETDDDGGEFAMLFQVETDLENKKYCIYNCKMSQGDEEHKTTEANDLGVQTSPLSIAISGEDVNGTMCYMKEVNSFETVTLPTFTESN